MLSSNKIKLNYLHVLIVFALLFLKGMVYGEWKPGDVPLMSIWAEQLDPHNVLPEYPRPQMVRSAWLNLNGLWQFEEASAYDSPPFDRLLADSILVPFPIESALSGITRAMDYAWYKRSFLIPAAWQNQRVLLHFGAVDWHCKVYLNRQLVFEHKGGYDPFVIDITDVVQFDKANELLLWVHDPTDAGEQPVGKQKEHPESIWFTAVTGIWQTVWLEPVPQIYIRSIKMVPDVDAEQLKLTVFLNEASTGTQVTAEVEVDSAVIARASTYGGAEMILHIPQAHLWSPEDPYLYTLKIKTQSASDQKDSVDSYFAMRKIGLKLDDQGRTRIALNNKIYFMIGPLDQGYWPAGLYTAPADQALKYDIEMAKKWGFNFIRKHVKVEPDRWYYWCDKLGMLVWQDMPNGGNFSLESKEQFQQELSAMVTHLMNHPSIAVWVVFNENWGKFDTQAMVSLVRSLDDTRLINANSGWNINGYDEGLGDINDIHNYPEPRSPAPEEGRAVVCGEYGGLWREMEGHTWAPFTGAGFSSGNAMALEYIAYTDSLQNLINQKALSAAVYTELTDVEKEYAGLLTYDRKVEKCYYLPIFLANTRTIATRLSQQTTGMGIDRFTLYQNFPNPFNSYTEIRFYLPRATNVMIRMFNVQGRKILTLKRRFVKAGLKKIKIDAQNWASGIYFYQVSAGAQSKIKKIILVR